MSKYPSYDRAHDERVFHRSFIVGLPMIALSIFLGWIAYRTFGTVPFPLGTTVLHGTLSLLSGAYGVLVLCGVILLDSRGQTYY